MRIETSQLAKLIANTSTPNSNTANPLSDFIKVYQDKWESIEQKTLDRIEGLPRESAEALSIQREMGVLALETEMLTKLADGLASSIRNIQQIQG